MPASSTVLPPTGVTSSQATLRGVVNPGGVQAVSYFEYGLTTGYGQTTTPVDVGSGSSDVPVSRLIAGLSPGQLYNYRCVLDTTVVPPSVFGATLTADYPRIGSSTGTVIHVSTLSALNAAIAAVPPDGIISVDALINGGGSQLNVNCNGSAGNPITITASGAGALTGFSQVYVTGTYIRFYQIPVHGCSLANLKLTGAANFIEIDGCEIYNSGRMGILVTGNASNIQIWNNVIHDNGSPINGNLDHGIYFSYARGKNVIASNVCYHNCAYNIQVYPDSPNVVLTCNTVDDGMVHAQSRGGIVIGSNPGSPQTINTINVGMLTTRAAQYGVALYNPGPGNNTYDALGFDNGSGDFQAGSGMTYTHCTHADPLFVDWDARDYHLAGGSPAIDYVNPTRYGLIPATDIEGNARVTADAGAYAA